MTERRVWPTVLPILGILASDADAVDRDRAVREVVERTAARSGSAQVQQRRATARRRGR